MLTCHLPLGLPSACLKYLKSGNVIENNWMCNREYDFIMCDWYRVCLLWCQTLKYWSVKVFSPTKEKKKKKIVYIFFFFHEKKIANVSFCTLIHIFSVRLRLSFRLCWKYVFFVQRWIYLLKGYTERWYSVLICQLWQWHFPSATVYNTAHCLIPIKTRRGHKKKPKCWGISKITR